MHVRCSYCSHSFNLGRDYIAAALPEALAQKHKTHLMECPNCRKRIKISVTQMKRFTPPPAEPAPEAEPAPADE
jgi:DNA-directed RNA polymerase subunit RPC12/RpoP